MATATFRVSERGQMSVPADARSRWGLAGGGNLEVIDLGAALLLLPEAAGGLAGLLERAIDEAGGYTRLVAETSATEPDLR